MNILNGIFEIIVGLLIAGSLSGCAVDEHTNYVVPTPTTIVETSETQHPNSNEGAKTLISKEDVLKYVDNDKTANELIKTIYAEEDLTKNRRLSNILQEQPPECARYTNGRLYFVYKYDTDNYLFLMYKSVEEDSYPSTWYLGEKFKLADFEKLTEEKATLETVQEFDVHGDYTSLYMGSTTSFYTYHHTIDGYMIRLDYEMEIGKPITISKITTFSGADNPIYYNLLPIDKELLQK